MSGFYNNAVFWIEVSKIKPNPYQPRREFDPQALQSLADSIRQYGILQPLVVTRQEIQKEDGGIATEYELISGERRLRASKLAGLSQVPALIREKEESDKVKLELAIIENLQREDLNPIERAEAFQKLVEEFGFKHIEVAKKVGKSREYVSNSMRLLILPSHIKEAIVDGKITEGHARPLLMLSSRPEEQEVLYKEVFIKKLTVRETEQIARRIATDKVRKKIHDDPRMINIENELSEVLGTRVRIEQKAVGGKITIDFFSDDDLEALFGSLNISGRIGSRAIVSEVLSSETEDLAGGQEEYGASEVVEDRPVRNGAPESVFGESFSENPLDDDRKPKERGISDEVGLDEVGTAKKSDEDEDLYSFKNFSI